MSKSLIYMVNESEQTIPDGGTVNFGSIIRRYGCNCGSNGSAPFVDGSGYYDVDASVVFNTGTGVTGTATATLYKNGVAIPGATQSMTVAADSTYSLDATGVIRQECCCEGRETITCRISGVATTVTNASIEVTKE